MFSELSEALHSCCWLSIFAALLTLEWPDSFILYFKVASFCAVSVAKYIVYYTD
jgi:hypothetical protein